MNRRFLIPIFLFFVLFSCSEDVVNDAVTTEFVQPDPTIISQYHILDSDGGIREKYTFDSFGNISKYRKITDDFEIHYNFDNEFKLNQIVKKDLDGNVIEILKNFEYELNNKLLKINDRDFTFSEVEQQYIDQSTYRYDEYAEEDGSFSSELLYMRYDIIENNQMPKLCRYIKYVEGTTEYDICDDIGSDKRFLSYNNNLTHYGSDFSGMRLDYDNNLNPLYFSSSNLVFIAGIFTDNFETSFLFNYETPLYYLINQNNLNFKIGGTLDDPIDDRGAREFTYQFNDLNLPEIGFIQPYLNEPSGPRRAYSKYYYQGDVIPE